MPSQTCNGHWTRNYIREKKYVFAIEITVDTIAESNLSIYATSNMLHGTIQQRLLDAYRRPIYKLRICFC